MTGKLNEVQLLSDLAKKNTLPEYFAAQKASQCSVGLSFCTKAPVKLNRRFAHGAYSVISAGTIRIPDRESASSKNRVELEVAVKRLRIKNKSRCNIGATTGPVARALRSCGETMHLPSPMMCVLDALTLWRGRATQADALYLEELEEELEFQLGIIDHLNKKYKPYPSELDHIHNEEDLLRKSQGTPFVVQYLFSHQTPRRTCEYWIVTELCVGNIRQFFRSHRLFMKKSLKARAESEAGETEEEVDTVAKSTAALLVHLLTPIMFALKHLHAKNILHRDIKEDNILITNYGVPKLCDFNLARDFTLLVRASETRTDAFDINTSEIKFTWDDKVGTDYYQAPELVCRKPFNSKVDIWSLGVTAFSLYMNLPMKKLFNISGWKGLQAVYQFGEAFDGKQFQQDFLKRLNLPPVSPQKDNQEAAATYELMNNMIRKFLIVDTRQRVSAAEWCNNDSFGEQRQAYHETWVDFSMAPTMFHEAELPRTSAIRSQSESEEIPVYCTKDTVFQGRMAALHSRLIHMLLRPKVDQNLRQKMKASIVLYHSSHRGNSLKNPTEVLRNRLSKVSDLESTSNPMYENQKKV